MAFEALSGLSGLSGVSGAAGRVLVAGVTGTSGVSGPGSLGSVEGIDGAAGTTGAASGFAATLASSLERVQQLHATSSELGVKAATGDLTDIHDFTIASTQARIATEVTVAVRNKGLEAFNDIMRMQV